MKKYFTLLLIVALFSGSCAMIYGTDTWFNVDHLPQYKLAAPKGNVVVINSFDFKKLKVKNDNKLEEIKSGVISGFNGLGDYLAGMTGGNYYNIADTAELAINTDDITVIAAKYKAAYVVALTNFYYNTNLERTEKQPDKPLKEAYFDLQVITGFTVYNAKGEKLQEFKSNLNEPFTNRQAPGSLIATFATASIKKNIPGFNQTVKNSMISAFNPLQPTSGTLNLRFFSDVELRPAIKEYQAGRLEKAEALLDPLINHPDATLAGKAAFNLAVVCYGMGKFTEAKKMAELSLQKFNNPGASNLLNALAGQESTSL